MDTISRENNSMLPVGGIIVGVVALLIGAWTAISLSKVKAQLAAHEEKIAKIDDIASQVSAASAASDKASKDITALTGSTQNAVNEIGAEIGTLKASVAKLEESAKRPVASGKHGAGGPVVAGPGEYVVAHGDSGAKIARANGVTLADLKAVNPSVNWSKLHVGEKIKLPEKKGAASPAAAAPAATP
jgi:LysM repeat protein